MKPPSRQIDDDEGAYEPRRNVVPFVIGGLLVAGVAVLLIAYLMRGGEGDDKQGTAPAPVAEADAAASMPVASMDAGALATAADAGATAGARNPPPRDRPPVEPRRKPDDPRPPIDKPDDPRPPVDKPDDPPKDENKAQADFYAKMGQTNLKDGDVLGAAANFKKALELDGSNTIAIVGLGEIALEQGSYAAAIGHFKKATRLSKNSRTWTLLGEAYLNSGDRAQAATAFKTALKLDPGNERARNGYEDATGGQ
jgi:tetratricopeptide (TPR) repeat protein